MTTARARLADVALLGATCAWGLTFVVVKDAMRHADALTFLALRFGVAAVVALPFALKGLREAGTWRRGGLLGVFLFLGYWLQTEGLRDTTPARSAFITGLTVVLVPFGSWAVLKRRPEPAAVVGAAVAALGLYVLTGSGGAGEGGLGWGDLLTLGCTGAYALHIVFTEPAAQGAAPFALVAVQVLLTAALSGGAALWRGPAVHWTPALGLAVVTTGVVASTLAMAVQIWAQARTSATRAALIFALEPVIASVASVALGQEALTAAVILGGALILSGVLVGELPFFRRAVGAAKG